MRFLSRAGLLRGGICLLVLLSCCTAIALGVLKGTPQAHADSSPAIILDTDMFSDVDDTGALGIINAKMDMGQATLLAVIVNTHSRYSATCASAINYYYGHPDVPIGIATPANSDDGYYVKNPCTDNFPHHLSENSIPSALSVYRQTLAAQPDHSVTIASVGFLGRLSELLDSSPDGASSLNGHDLVNQKVKELVVMGGGYPTLDFAEFNFAGEADATVNVVNNWPTRIVFDGFEVGVGIGTGHTLSSSTPDTNPVRASYENYVGAGNDRSSWDVTAAYYALTHDSNLFQEVGNGSNQVDSDGSNRWVDNPVKANQSYLVVPDGDALGRAMEELLDYIPGSGGGPTPTPTPTRTPTPTPTPTPNPGGPLPSPWQSQDIGSVGQGGSASYNNGTFTVSGGGDDIWNSADAFRYVYQSLNGDGTIIAKVNSVQNTNEWAKAGVMIRESLTTGSRHAFSAITSGQGSAFQRRTSTNGGSDHTAGPSVTAPYWVKLVRSGNTFTGSVSSDSSSWTQVGSVTISIASNAYVGLAVTAHNNSALNTATFSNVSVTTGGTSTPTPTPTPGTTPTPTPTPTSGQLVKAINAGGSASGTFVADTGANQGNQYSDTSSSISTSGVSNPAPQAVYQTCRWNDAFSYTITGLSAGSSYKVRLHWAELTFQTAGDRTFNVAINGSSVLSNFDVYATAGYKHALVREFTVTADSSGQLVIAFTQAGADNPFISGIEVYTA